MRTIKLTDEQIALLHQALGIAEAHFTKIYTDIVNTTLVVRKNRQSEEQNKNAKFYHEIACNMADLNNDIDAQDLDV